MECIPCPAYSSAACSFPNGVHPMPYLCIHLQPTPPILAVCIPCPASILICSLLLAVAPWADSWGAGGKEDVLEGVPNAHVPCGGNTGGPLRPLCRRRAHDAGGVAPDAAVLHPALQGRDPAGGQGGAAQAVRRAVALPGGCSRTARQMQWNRRCLSRTAGAMIRSNACL